MKPIDLEAFHRMRVDHGGRYAGQIGLAHAVNIHAGDSEAFAKALIEAGIVEYAQPDVISYPAAIPNDTFWVDGLEDWQHAYNYQKGGSVQVGVMDTGCNTFTDFGANVMPGWNVLTSTSDVTDTDTDSHGTASCSVIAADSNNGSTGGGVSGLGWGIKVVPLKITNTGAVLHSNAAAAITWALANAPSCKVFTMQVFGSGTTAQTLIDAVQAAWDANCIVCCSAGNSDNTTSQTPANTAHVVAVSGCYGTSRDRYFANNPGGSSYGPWTEASGHLGIIVSEIQKAYNKVGAAINYQGTSSSAPAFAAACALLWSYKPTATNQQILDAILNNADPAGADFGSPPHPAKALNVYRAIDSLRSDSPKNLVPVPCGGF